MEIDTETLSRLTKWAEDAHLKLADLVEKYEKHYSNLKELYPDKDDKFYNNRARFMTYREIKSARYVRAKPVDGIFFGYNEEFDLTRNARQFAIEMFQMSPEKAIDQGYTDEKGTPLDTQKVMPWGAANTNFGKPLLPRYIRQSVGIGYPSEGGDMKLISLTHIGDQALKKAPLGVPVRFLANIRQEDADRRVYNSSIHTSYEQIKMKEFPDADEGTVCDILSNAPEKFKSDLAGLEAWIYANEADRFRVCISEVDVMYLATEPNTRGSYRMVVEDETTMDIEGEGVTAWVHGQLADLLTFGPGSRIYVLHRPNMSAAYDRETRTSDTSRQVPVLNVLGLWAIPEYRIAPEEGFTVTTTEEVDLG